MKEVVVISDGFVGLQEAVLFAKNNSLNHKYRKIYKGRTR